MKGISYDNDIMEPRKRGTLYNSESDDYLFLISQLT